MVFVHPDRMGRNPGAELFMAVRHPMFLLLCADVITLASCQTGCECVKTTQTPNRESVLMALTSRLGETDSNAYLSFFGVRGDQESMLSAASPDADVCS